MSGVLGAFSAVDWTQAIDVLPSRDFIAKDLGILTASERVWPSIKTIRTISDSYESMAIRLFVPRDVPITVLS